MNKETQIEDAIHEFRQAKNKIRQIIGEYQEKERRLFKVMLNRISIIDENKCSSKNNFRSEQHRSLDKEE